MSPGWWAALRTSFELGLRRASAPRRLAPCVLVLAAAVAVAAYVRARPELMPLEARAALAQEGRVRPLAQVRARPPGDVVLFGSILGRLYIPLGVVTVALLLTLEASASRAERRSLPFVLARGAPRSAYFLGRRLACDAVHLALAVPGSFVLFAVACPQSRDDAWIAYAGAFATALAVLAYDAAFSLIALAPRAVVGLGLLYGFVWELGLGELDFRVRAAAISYHLRALVIRTITEERELFYQAFEPAPRAVLVVVVAIAILTGLGAVAFGRLEHDPRSSA